MNRRSPIDPPKNPSKGRLGISIEVPGILFLGGLTLLSGVAAADWGLPDLMHQLAHKRTGSATFVEHKTLADLDHPLESTGTLAFVAPSHLEKRTLTPHPEAMILDGDTLILQRDGHDKTVDLEEQPEVAAFVESIRGTLAGDQRALERHFTVTLSGNPAHWSLKLIPRDAAVGETFRQILIGGEETEVERIEIDQPDGDHSVMQITPMVPRVP